MKPLSSDIQRKAYRYLTRNDSRWYSPRLVCDKIGHKDASEEVRNLFKRLHENGRLRKRLAEDDDGDDSVGPKAYVYSFANHLQRLSEEEMNGKADIDPETVKRFEMDCPVCNEAKAKWYEYKMEKYHAGKITRKPNKPSKIVIFPVFPEEFARGIIICTNCESVISMREGEIGRVMVRGSYKAIRENMQKMFNAMDRQTRFKSAQRRAAEK